MRTGDRSSAQCPAAALEAGREAHVVLELVLDAEGRVAEAKVVEPAGFGFDEAALGAAAGFRFTPAMRGDTPVRFRIRCAYEFRLPAAPVAAAAEEERSAPAAAAGGDAAWVALPPADGAPINVVVRGASVYRGVVPVRFGADALGGAVNLVSESEARARHGSVSWQAGAFGTQRLAASVRPRHEGTGLFARVSGFLDRATNDYPIDVEVRGIGRRPHAGAGPSFPRRVPGGRRERRARRRRPPLGRRRPLGRGARRAPSAGARAGARRRRAPSSRGSRRPGS